VCLTGANQTASTGLIHQLNRLCGDNYRASAQNESERVMMNKSTRRLILTGVEVRAQGAAGELAGQLRRTLALVGLERGDVHQGLDLGVVGGGLADDAATAGVAGQDDGAVDAVEETAHGGCVLVQPAQRVGGGDDRVAGLLQLGDDVVPRRSPHGL
jgi:hypothetical protein